MNSFSPQAKLVLIVSVLASFVSFLDGFIVTVALPAIEADLGGGLVAQQWVVNAYLLTLSALMLLAGSLSDIFGRRRILAIGLVGFAVMSLLCAIAPSALFLIIARALQGAGGALLVPSSLALIMATFSGADQGRAIGTWTAWTTVSAFVGPLFGGLLVDWTSWRLIFGINILPIALTLWLMRSLEVGQPAEVRARVDITGAILATAGLAGVTYAFIEQPNRGWGDPLILSSLIAGGIALALFVIHEYRAKAPMLPLKLFAIRNFGFGNVATFFVYGGLSVSAFLIIIFLQQIAGYSAFAAGLTFLPVSIIMFFLSSYFGTLAGKYGPRLFMTIGPVIAGLGFLLMLGADDMVNYWLDLLPGVVLFGLGLAATVAPLTTAVLGCIEKRQSGIASATNNAISRIAGLVAVAVIGVFVGPELTVSGFHTGLWFIAALLLAGGAISALGIDNSQSGGLHGACGSVGHDAQ
jgi:EmrB/QacA subfamily drug resistance transporter